MNLKTEKIEQFIQIINRNLLLVQAGQEDSVTPLDFRNLQKIDATIFGIDKFAYEMIHFVKSGSDNRPPEGSLLYKWESCFVRGLETLMVECGVVKDEIERDCLIGRVYCWFSEKLSDRRELPRPALDYAHLKESVEAIVPPNQSGSTIKALDNFEISKATEASALSSVRPRTADEANMSSPKLANVAATALMKQRENLLLVPDTGKKVNSTISGLPVIPQILGPITDPYQRPRSTPAGGEYSISKRQQYENQITSLLPKLPTQESNYGMLYHKPESESEIIMHEMWLARRRQEAFDWKAQQQITLLMDRIGLHKSRVESEALRKQESGSYLSEVGASSSSGNINMSMTDSLLPLNHGSKSISKFVPLISGDRPLSAKRHNAIAAREMAEAGYNSPGYVSSPDGHLVGGGPTRGGFHGFNKYGSPDSPMSPEPAEGSPEKFESPTTRTMGRGRGGTSDGAGDTMLSVTGGNVGKEETTVSKASRHPTSKTTHRSYVPMRFKNDHLAAKVHSYDRQHYYMQGSDSEEEDDMKERSKTAGLPNIKSGTAPAAMMNNSTSALPDTPAVTTNLSGTQPRKTRGPVHRDRPKASGKFKEVAFNDPEAKVHYRHTNYRRMPMTQEQTQWLAAQEQDRKVKAEEAAKAAAEAAAAAKKKKEEKSKKKEEKNKGKGGKKKDGKKEPEKKAVTVEVKKSKYKSPAHFMAKNFPTFDMGESVKYNPKTMKPTPSMENLPPGSAAARDGGADSLTSSTHVDNKDGGGYNPYSLGDITDENYGPMRTMQMIECNRIMDVCDDWNVPMDPKVLYRALVIPQDKPYAITLEQGVHNPVGGLMTNPMSKEHWKHVPPDLCLAGGKKKIGGKKKKK